MREFEILVCYNRECDLNDDFFKVVRVIADSPEKAFKMVDNYEIENMFDDIENDYLEDSLYSLKVLSDIGHPVQ